MKAIILDYADGSINVLRIPKEHEEDANEYVEGVINATNCEWILFENEEIPMYEIKPQIDENGEYIGNEYERIESI